MNANPSVYFSPGSRIAVLLPVGVPGPYDYRVGAEPLAVGAIVRVPLGPRRLWGVVWGPGDGAIDDQRLRAVEAVSQAPPLNDITRRFVDWVAAYTLAQPGMVLKMVLPVPDALEPPRAMELVVSGVLPVGWRITEARARVLAHVTDNPPLTATDLAREAGVSPGVVRDMITAGALGLERVAVKRQVPQPDTSRHPVTLSLDQGAAARALIAAVEDGFSTHLLDGVTGSGKTEVYLEAVAHALARGRQVLVLLPEIALSAQWLDRFTARFGVPPSPWHSELGDAERRETWRQVSDGRAKVVVGARSALFLPYADLGLIVVDEEHDGAFKQEDGVCYNARDMAVVRAKLGAIPVVLASATPSLETMSNVEAGRYALQQLPDRHGGAQLPQVSIVDLRRQPPPRGRFLSPPLTEAVGKRLEAGEQSMLFLNRRGYAPLTLCRACGFRLQCPDCSAWLIEHRSSGRLACHHCGHWQRLPQTCPACGERDCFTACGPGIERIAEEVSALWPEARLAVAASDTLTGPRAAQDLIQAVIDRRVDILVGTQILAKGHHFPQLTLVGVVDADMGLEGGDLRASERTWQMLHQVAGRAGRAGLPGEVILQSWQPNHPVIKTLAGHDRAEFMAVESESRHAAGMPPFGRLAALIVSGRDADQVDGYCRALARAAPEEPLHVLGPVPAPLALLKGRHRRRFLIKAPRSSVMQTPLRQWLASIPVPSGIRVQVDIDPYSFF